ncbi:MAG: hypothetical protein JWP74_530 [Marmoricola sp.]|nr:hypothetical protein [Marmoricola sp.]
MRPLTALTRFGASVWGRVVAVTSWTVHRLRSLWGWVESIGTKALILLPQTPIALLKNRTVRRNNGGRSDSAIAAAAVAESVDIDAATALWQSETDRLTGLATKGAAVLAADALVLTGVVQLSSDKGVVRIIFVLAIAYLLFAIVAACLAQRPMPRHGVTSQDVLDGIGAREMVIAVEKNVPLTGIMNNLVSASLSDTLVSLLLLLAAVVVKVTC